MICYWDDSNLECEDSVQNDCLIKTLGIDSELTLSPLYHPDSDMKGKKQKEPDQDEVLTDNQQVMIDSRADTPNPKQKCCDAAPCSPGSTPAMVHINDIEDVSLLFLWFISH